MKKLTSTSTLILFESILLRLECICIFRSHYFGLQLELVQKFQKVCNWTFFFSETYIYVLANFHKGSIKVCKLKVPHFFGISEFLVFDFYSLYQFYHRPFNFINLTLDLTTPMKQLITTRCSMDGHSPGIFSSTTCSSSHMHHRMSRKSARKLDFGSFVT